MYEYFLNYTIRLTQTGTVISWFHLQQLFVRIMK